MEVLACGHCATAAGARVCVHLTTEDTRDCYRVLTGVATRFDLLCEPCADAEAPELLDACVGCFERAETDAYLGWRGAPEIRRHDRDLGGTWTTWDGLEPRNDRCLAALPDGWLVWTDAGLAVLGPEPRYAAWVRLPEEPPSEWAGRVRGPALHTSADGRFAAAVTDHGRHGAIVDLASGEVTLELDRGDYHPEQTPFPVAFVGSRVVAATDWNRLDAFDPATGRLLTDRDRDGDRSIDYFFGALLPSPSGRRLLADGWVWSPFGVPVVIDCAAWFGGDRYAPEHPRRLAQRAYAWGDPLGWLDDETVVQQRIGDDDEQMIDGVTRYDAVTGRRTGVFAGPAGRMWTHRGLLYVAAEAGLEVWDPADGARVGLLEGFAPIAHHDGAFAELRNDQLRIWSPVG
ncbi:hypothetical protein [Amycolatopsis sp. NPDC098790]|uniref:hypothetical protein n=1 Tax=Amycolatopsis sp. NPDC098790 TaxID=3363939 RepID=UPI0037F454AD